MFRKEALQQTNYQSAESPLSIDNGFFRKGVIIVLALLLAIIAYFIIGTYTPKQTVSGYIVSQNGLAKLHAPYSATILERFVVPGEQVKAGDILYRLEKRQSTVQSGGVGEELLAMLEQRREVLLAQKTKTQQAAKLELSNLKARIPVVKKQLTGLKSELDARRKAQALYQSEIDRLRKMLQAGVVSRSVFEQKQAQFLERQAAVSALERQVLGLQSELTDLQSQYQVTELHNAKQLANYDKELALLEQEIIQVSASTQAVIRAPIAGTVTGLIYEPGQYVTPQTPLLTILPTGGSLQARLLVPSRAIGFIQAGQSVNLRYRAFPYQQYGTYAGIVLRVSRSAMTPGNADLPMTIQAPVYLVTVELAAQSVQAYGQKYPLQTGMLLEADIVTGHMQLYEWLLQPLYRLQGTL